MTKLAFYTQTYNSEKYMRKSIESVLNQIFQDFTYYIADDVSTDSTRKILKEYAEKDSRIKLIFAEENNMMQTTNNSLNMIYNSGCEYLATLDADDWYDVNFAETAIKYMEEEQLDLVCVGTQFINEVDGSKSRLRGIQEDIVISKNEYANRFPDIMAFFITHWGKLFKIDILKNNNVLMDTSIFYGADTTFIYDLMPYVNKLAIVKGSNHNYLSRITSASYTYKPERKEEILKLYNKQRYFLRTLDLYEQTSVYMAMNFVNNILDGIELDLINNIPVKLQIDSMIDYFNDKDVKEAIKLAYDYSNHFKRVVTRVINTVVYCIKNTYLKDYREKELFCILTMFSKDIDIFWTEGSMEKWSKYPEITNTFLLGEFENIQDLYKLNNDEFIKQVETYIYLKYNKVDPCVCRNQEYLTDRQLNYMFNNNNILNKYKENELKSIYNKVYFEIIDNNFINACRLIIDEVSQNQQMDLSDFKLLSGILKDVAALSEDVEYFIYAHQMETIVAIQLKDELGFTKAIENLMELNVNENLIKMYEDMFFEQQ